MLDPNLELSEEKKNLLTATTSTTLCSTDYTDRGDLTWYNLCVCTLREGPILPLVIVEVKIGALFDAGLGQPV